MKKTIREMHETLADNTHVAFISACEDYQFALRKSDKFSFIEDNLLVIKRKSGRNSIINMNLIIEVCIRNEMI